MKSLKIQKASFCNRRRCFTIKNSRGVYELPYRRAELIPTKSNPVVSIGLDAETANHCLVYHLKDGQEGFLHNDQFLDFNCDPDYLENLHLHNLTVKAQELFKTSGLTKNQIARTMKTSQRQLNRLLDQTFYGKSINSMLKLLNILGVEVEFKFKKVA